jgi:NAD(P)-dependent dehydrogenase (short-subunit alcohol dehydrogenase family)
MAPLIWFITGTTSGIGAALVNEVLARGDQVIAANRQVSQMASLASDNVSLLELDLTSSHTVIVDKAKEAWEMFGHIDVLVNNAGTFLMAPFEEVSDVAASRLLATNVLGPLALTRALLPLFRARGSGTVVFTSSNQLWGNMPYTTHYNMSKWMNSCLAESLHKEVSGLGIRCMAFECGGVVTRLFERREKDETDAADGQGEKGRIEAYKPGFGAAQRDLAEWGAPPGDAVKVARVMADVVRGEGVAVGRAWASRIALGSDSLRWWKIKRQQEEVVRERWEDVSLSTDRDDTVVSDKLDRFALVAGAE